MLRTGIILLAFLIPAAEIFAGEVVLCRRNKLKNKTSCVAKYNSEKPRRNNQVIIRNENGSWVATGTVKQVKDSHFICSFTVLIPIKRGDKAKVIPFKQESIISYDSAFE